MLSIIIITKNEEKTLGRLLNSIKKQNYKNYEIIVSDAKSTDKTRQIAKKYGCKIVNGGLPSVGRNRGGSVAKGEILLFLDSDSKLSEGFLEECLKEFLKRELVIAIPIWIPLSGVFFDRLMIGAYMLFLQITQYFMPSGGGLCIMCKKETFKKIRGFNEKLVLGEDIDFIRRHKKYGKFRILKSKPVFIDIRRLKKEGRIIYFLKTIIFGFNQVILHRKYYSSVFNYETQGVNITKLNKK